VDSPFVLRAGGHSWAVSGPPDWVPIRRNRVAAHRGGRWIAVVFVVDAGPNCRVSTNGIAFGRVRIMADGIGKGLPSGGRIEWKEGNRDVRGGAVPLERPRPFCGCLRCTRPAPDGGSPGRAVRDVTGTGRRDPAFIGATLTVAVGQATTVPPARHSTR
jgi:hypothetical protein